MNKYIICPVCKKEYKRLTIQHIRGHGYKTTEEFKRAFNLTTVFSEQELERMKRYGIRNHTANHLTLRNRLYGNPMKGRKHTKETINKMKRNRKGKAIGKAGKYERTKEIREKIARGVAKTHSKHVYGNNEEILPYTDKTNKDVIVRSSWEKRIFIVLDTHPLVTKIVVEPFGIPYVFEGQTHIYIPDFYFEYEYGAIKEVWEIKPEWAIKHRPINRAKIKALNNYALENKMNACLITKESEIEHLEYLLGIEYDKELGVSFIMSSFTDRDLFKEALSGKWLPDKNT